VLAHSRRPQERHPVGIGPLRLVLQHGVLTELHRESTDIDALRLQTLVEIVVLSAPAVIQIGHPVDLLELDGVDGHHAAKETAIGQSESPVIQGGAHVTWPLGAGVNLTRVQGQQVHVVKNQARESILGRHLGADVEEHRSVEGLVIELLDQENPIVDQLLGQVIVHVGEEGVQLLLPLPVRHNDGGAVACLTSFRTEFASRMNFRAPLHRVVVVGQVVDEPVLGNDLRVVAFEDLLQRHIPGHLRQQSLLDPRFLDVLVVGGKPEGQAQVHDEGDQPDGEEQVIDVEAPEPEPHEHRWQELLTQRYLWEFRILIADAIENRGRLTNNS